MNEKWKKLGGEVLQTVKNSCVKKSQELDDNPYNQMDLRLRLARGWVRAVRQ